MADGERRMLFDIRGRRKHVIKVVYAILAVLMGASLFLVVGPVNIGSLLNTSGQVNESAKIFDEQAERIEERLRRSPNDEDMLISLTRARINAGRAKSEVEQATGRTTLTANSRAEYLKAVAAWQRYLKQAGGEPNPSVASLVAGSIFLLAENSRSYPEALEYVSEAAAAQRLAAEGRPSVGTWTALAAYEYLAGHNAAGADAGKKALALAGTKSERKSIEKQLASFKKQSKQIQKEKKKAEKFEKKQGKESLENPLGGFSGSSGSTITP